MTSTLWKEKTILVVEDDDVSTEFLAEVLMPTGVQIISVSNGEEAVEACKNNKIDLVLMDIRLPVMSGHSALIEIKKFNRDLIIIAQTAFAMSGDKEKYISIGFDDYISKPIYPKDLIDLLSKYLD
ncbi:MAG: response regulator [Bacteroidales bacterium]|nr:response regulator [Bacteroidales bacterium]